MDLTDEQWQLIEPMLAAPVPARREAARQRNRWLLIGGGILATLLLGAFALWPRPTAGPIPEARLADDPALGSASSTSPHQLPPGHEVWIY